MLGQRQNKSEVYRIFMLNHFARFHNKQISELVTGEGIMIAYVKMLDHLFAPDITYKYL